MKARNPETGMCLDTMARSIGSELGVSPCHGMGGNQVCNVHKRTQTALPTTWEFHQENFVAPQAKYQIVILIIKIALLVFG